MPGGLKGIESVRKNFSKTIEEIRGPRTRKVLEAVLIEGAANAAAITPILNSDLINSQYRDVEVTVNGMRGEVGYGVFYAAAVHDAPGTLKGQPREDFGMTSNRSSYGPTIPKAFGGGTGNYWDPDAEPEFLTKGFERDGLAAIKMIVSGGYKI